MRICLTIFFALFVLASHAQPRKAIKDFENARMSFAQGRMDEGEAFLKSALLIDPNYIEARSMLAEHYYRSERYEEALIHYENLATELMDDHLILYRWGMCQYWTDNFLGAIESLELYIDHPNSAPKYQAFARKIIENCRFAITAVSRPQDYQIQNMGESINTKWMEYFPAMSANGETFYFTRNQGWNGRYQEDFYFSNAGENGWSIATELEGSLNTDDNEGAMSISSDGNALFFTACQREEGAGSCDIFISLKRNGVWGKAFPLPREINSAHWESQPSISFDGKRLYFVSNRPGGYGGKDIWYSDFIGGGEWSEAKNLGEMINTTGDEMTPFIHWDNQHLYFASEGHQGIGGLDLFVSEFEEGDWASPSNLGYPLNSQKDESGMIVSPDGSRAYFAAEGLEVSFGMIDIYEFRLPEEYQANRVAYLEGRIYDAITNDPLSCKFEILDLESGELREVSYSAKDGSYYLCLPIDKSFSMQVLLEGYLFASHHFSLKTQSDDQPERLDIPLSPIESGGKLVLRNVFFDHDESKLKESSFNELDLLLDVLMKNPELRIEIGGHTDNVGSSAHNLTLSKARAKSVESYLIEKGVESSRMEIIGYGDQNPVANNDTESGRQKNRRTEIKFL